MPFELMSLPYAHDALEPHISRETIEYHHGKHHAGYVTKLNGLVAGTENEGKTLEELIQTASGGLFNNAAQVWNHNFYWHSMAPNAGGAPTGPIADAINATWGSFEEFKKAFNQEAANHFASGWAWLVKKDGALRIVSTHDASNPIREDLGTPILTCDVWEHAYYIDYRNARATYLESWWNLVNWEFANANFTA